MPNTHTIHLSAVELAAFSAKMRRRNRGATAQLCALTPEPRIRVDCGQLHPGLRHVVASHGQWRYTGPMQRGHISRLFDRVHLRHGPDVVRRTFGVGIRALRAEPRHVWHGGQA